MNDSNIREVLISVDIEASGPSPSAGSLISIGACAVDDPEVAIYLELQPLPDRPWDKGAARVHQLDRTHLERDGLEPEAAMARFETWIAETSNGARPVFVGFNAPFDWMFVADYFWRFIGRNPFGVSALDLKSYYMAVEKVEHWEETRRAFIDERLGLAPDHSHQALEDARGQAVLARLLIVRPRTGGPEPI